MYLLHKTNRKGSIILMSLLILSVALMTLAIKVVQNYYFTCSVLILTILVFMAILTWSCVVVERSKKDETMGLYERMPLVIFVLFNMFLVAYLLVKLSNNLINFIHNVMGLL